MWQGDGNLFIQDDGRLIGRSTSYQAYKRHIRRYNEWVRENPEEAKKQQLEPLPEIPLHGLRHSCATLLNYLWDERIHGALESSLQQDEDFQKATRISNNAVGAEYGRVAYRQGFSDSLKLLSELYHLS